MANNYHYLKARIEEIEVLKKAKKDEFDPYIKKKKVDIKQYMRVHKEIEPDDDFRD